MRFVLTGGGTGGHAYPAISIGEALRAEYPDCELLFIGTRDSIEERLAITAGMRFTAIAGRKLKKAMSVGTVLAMASLARGIVEASSVLRGFRPDVVIGTGGYASAAVVLAHALRGGKSIIHEADAIPGRTNRWLSRFAVKVCVASEDSLKFLPPGKTVVTGLAIRSELLSLPKREKARKALGLDANAFTILVFGGSQGARKLNEVVAESIAGLKELPVQILHQTGQKNYDEALARAESIGWDRYQVRGYLDDMRSAYAAADLVVCRSGFGSISEITAVGLPSILVPYPYSYADHQTKNAEFVARSGGALMISDSDFSAEFLVKMVKRFIEMPHELQGMAAASKGLGKPDAAKDIARIAVELAKK